MSLSQAQKLKLFSRLPFSQNKGWQTCSRPSCFRQPPSPSLLVCNKTPWKFSLNAVSIPLQLFHWRPFQEALRLCYLLPHWCLHSKYGARALRLIFDFFSVAFDTGDLLLAIDNSCLRVPNTNSLALLLLTDSLVQYPSLTGLFSYASQMNLKLAMQPRFASDSRSSCFSLLSVGNIGIYHRVNQYMFLGPCLS